MTPSAPRFTPAEALAEIDRAVELLAAPDPVAASRAAFALASIPSGDPDARVLVSALGARIYDNLRGLKSLTSRVAPGRADALTLMSIAVVNLTSAMACRRMIVVVWPRNPRLPDIDRRIAEAVPVVRAVVHAMADTRAAAST